MDQFIDPSSEKVLNMTCNYSSRFKSLAGTPLLTNTPTNTHNSAIARPNMPGNPPSQSSSNGQSPYTDSNSTHLNVNDSSRPTLPPNIVDPRLFVHSFHPLRSWTNVEREVTGIPQMSGFVFRSWRSTTQRNIIHLPPLSNLENFRAQGHRQGSFERVRPVPSDAVSQSNTRIDSNIRARAIQLNIREGIRCIRRRQDIPPRTAPSAQSANFASPRSRPISVLLPNRQGTRLQLVIEPTETVPRTANPPSRSHSDPDGREIQPNPPKRLKVTPRNQDVSSSSRNLTHSRNPPQPDHPQRRRAGQDLPNADPEQILPNSSGLATHQPEVQSPHGHIGQAFWFRSVPEDTPCDICGALFCDADAVKRHKRSQHPPPRSQIRYLQCQICQVMLKSEANLRRHKRIHGDGAHLTCPKCDVKFRSDRSRIAHRRVAHGDHIPTRVHRREPAKCPADGCNYSSNQRCNIDRHFRSVHLLLRSFECDVEGCSYRATTKGNLEAHKTFHE